MHDLDFTGVFIVGAFFLVLAIAGVIGVAVSWLGYPTAALWIIGAGIVAGGALAKYLRSKC